MRKSKSEGKKRNLKKGEVLYPVYLGVNTHVHLVKGNKKVGDSIYCLNLLPGTGYLTLKDGTQLTNVSGTCKGCGEVCENKCYAVRDGKYHHNSTIIKWAENTLLVRYKLEQFFAEFREMCLSLVNPVIRIHSDGEYESYEYFSATALFYINNPWVTGYCYTKREEWVNRFIEENDLCDYVRETGKIAPNFIVLISRWNEWKENKYGLPIFVFDDGTNPDLKNRPHCPAVDENGEDTGVTCSLCKSCIKGISKCVYDHSMQKLAKMRAIRAKIEKEKGKDCFKAKK